MVKVEPLRLALGATVVITILTASAIPAKSEMTRDEYVAIYNSLKQPLGNILESTRSTAFSFAKERRLDNVKLSEGLLEMCQTHIGRAGITNSKERQKRFVYIMKVYQELVKQVQKVQITESRLNSGKPSLLLKNIRDIEFMLRDFVETTLRNAATDIVQPIFKKTIPTYSIGNNHLKSVTISKKDTSRANLEVLNAVLLCSENFLKNDVMQVAGDETVLSQTSVDAEKQRTRIASRKEGAREYKKPLLQQLVQEERFGQRINRMLMEKALREEERQRHGEEISREERPKFKEGSQAYEEGRHGKKNRELHGEEFGEKEETHKMEELKARIGEERLPTYEEDGKEEKQMHHKEEESHAGEEDEHRKDLEREQENKGKHEEEGLSWY